MAMKKTYRPIHMEEKTLDVFEMMSEDRKYERFQDGMDLLAEFEIIDTPEILGLDGILGE